MRRLPHLLIPAALTLFAVSACGATDDAASNAAGTSAGPAMSGAASAPESSSAPASTSPVSASADAVPEALRFSAPLVGGGTFDGAAYSGKPLALWFWGPT